MSLDLIAAEVMPVAGKAAEAAKALQKLGLQVLHVGATSVSVQAAESVWTELLGLEFETRTKQRSTGPLRGPVSYKWPLQEPAPIPLGLDQLVTAIAFVEPPEFFG